MTPARELAAGGVVGRDGKVLLVQVKNLEGEVVWTFPKGHLEAGETRLQAALREVEEETGWKCRSLGALSRVSYRFKRNGKSVFKRVSWYRMKPLRKTGKPDADEIRKTKWVAAASAEKILSYRSDLLLIKRYLKRRAKRETR